MSPCQLEYPGAGSSFGSRWKRDSKVLDFLAQLEEIGKYV